MGFVDMIRQTEKVRDGRVRRWELVVVDAAIAALGVDSCSEIIRRVEWHMATVAVGLGFRWVVKRARTVTRDATQEKRVEVILAA